MGVNLPNYLNMTALVENLGFADISGARRGRGRRRLRYHSSTNPNGPFGRNLIALAGAALPQYTATGAPLLATVENKSLLYPQSGYTPTVVLPGGMLGFGLLPASLAGTTLGIQCWMLDRVTSTIVDVTNVAVVRF